MLTDEQVREIQIRIEDRGKRWGVEPGEFLNFVESLLKDRAEMQAEIERLRELYLDMGCHAAGGEYTMRHYEEEIGRLRTVVEAAKAAIGECAWTPKCDALAALGVGE